MTLPADQVTEALRGFTPAVRDWFRSRFAAPSPAQALAWPVTRRGENTLLLAPTGSGKTLAAFLCAIDDLCRRAQAGALPEGVQVLYITPLKALGNDIRHNLLEPLAGIRARAGSGFPDIRVAVRTGDTPQAERQRMVRHPPHILITTPESLFLALGSRRLAPALATVHTVIVDEVHALCDSKRGVHLAVSLERLEALVAQPLQRVGCSATIHPLEDVAHYLTGYTDAGRPRPCTLVDAGMRKDLDVRVIAPLPDFLAAGHDALWASAYELLVREIAAHRTTLVFCNSRYKAERTALRLAELAGERLHIGVHHGSMSRETRLAAEDQLKAGLLNALVCTSSLELGIDIGTVDLVVHLESATSVASGLQRIGRAGHLLAATSKGRFLILERDELFEAAAICRAMLAGRIDPIRIPRGCLDVLAQQAAGIVATGAIAEEALFALVRRSYPYAALRHDEFDAVLQMLAGERSFDLARPPRALLLWDRASGRLSPARGADMVAAMCVGTIPDTAEYDVLIEGTGKRVGRVHAEFVDDALRTGDVFVLGSTAWRVAGKRRNRLLVTPAPGTTPTVPWWQGPVVPRTAEVGREVGTLRRAVAARLDDAGLAPWLQREYCLDADAASALIDYVREQRAAVGLVPDDANLLVESWTDELGQANLILHSPFGQRLNLTWGLALTAAAKSEHGQTWSSTATNDLILLTLSAAKSARGKPVDARQLIEALTPESLAAALDQAVRREDLGGSPFRDAAVCALQVLRAKDGKAVPVWLQSHRAQELFDAAGAASGYPVITEVRRRYLQETLDAPGLSRLLQDVGAGRIRVHYRTVQSPSPFSHSLLVQDMYRGGHQMGRDRRAYLLRLHQQVLREVLSSDQLAQLLDPRAIDRLELRRLRRSETTQARTADELAQALHELGDIPATLEAVQAMVDGDALGLLRDLVTNRRVVAFRIPGLDEQGPRLLSPDHWREYHDAFARPGQGTARTLLLPVLSDNGIAGFATARVSDVVPSRWRKSRPQHEARRAVVERYLRCRGPVTLYDLMNHTGWPAAAVEALLDGFTAAGAVACGIYRGDRPRPQWVNRANLEEIHRSTLHYLKHELAACQPYEVVDFLTRWQHRHPACRLEGVDGLRTVIAQLQGFEVVQGALEAELLSERLRDYSPALLDRLIASGEVCWGRVGPGIKRGKLTVCFRQDRPWLMAAAERAVEPHQPSDVDIAAEVERVRAFFRARQTAFFDDAITATGLGEDVVLRAVWSLAWRGEITCDSYECVRHADFQVSVSDCYDLGSTSRKIVRGVVSPQLPVLHIREKRLDPRLGRWTATERLVPGQSLPASGEVVRRWAQQLLRRWGIVSKDLLAAEVAAPPWEGLQREFKRLELTGKVNRGYFIESHQGEQYGLPEAIELLRDCRARRSDRTELGYLADEPVFCLSSRDPANLYTYTLDIVEERGSVLKRAVKSGNVVHRLAVQAGQVLVFDQAWATRQLATLTRRQLERCLGVLEQACTAAGATMLMQSWNGHPIVDSPVAPVLWQRGYRLDGRRCFCWPPPRRPLSDPAPAAAAQDVFLPYYQEPAPRLYDEAWVIAHASEHIRPKLQELIAWLRGFVPPECTFAFGSWGVAVPYRGKRCISPRIGRKQLRLQIQHRGWSPGILIAPDTDLSAPEFRRQVEALFERARREIDARYGSR